MSTAREKFELTQQRYAATFERHLDNGVNFISRDVYIEPEVVIAPGATILPGCILRGKTVIGAHPADFSKPKNAFRRNFPEKVL